MGISRIIYFYLEKFFDKVNYDRLLENLHSYCDYVTVEFINKIIKEGYIDTYIVADRSQIMSQLRTI